MTQYINKDAIVAEIEKRRKNWWYGSSIEAKYKREECVDILSFINNLEVKEIQEVKKEDYWENKYKEVLEQFKAQKGE